MKTPSKEFKSRLPVSDEADFDVLIVGGGLVGSSLALALCKLPLKVGLIEPHLQTSPTAPGFDSRSIALSWGSCRIFNGIGIWDSLRSSSTAIKNIHISDKGTAGICRLNAKEMNVESLGNVIELDEVASIIQNKLLIENKEIAQVNDLQSIHDKSNLNAKNSENGFQFIQGKVVQMELSSHFRTVTVKTVETRSEDTDLSHQQTLADQSEFKIKAKLVVAADGKNSPVRTLANIKATEKSYDQYAIITTLQTQLPHQNTAYERFTRSGPVAFLPLSDNRISLVWILDEENSHQIMNVSEDEFINRLQDLFGYRLGRITKVGKRFSYPLSLLTANQCIADRLVLVGNAAQSLHPIAGQGFNLGLRDVAALCDALRDCCMQTLDPGSHSILQQYQQLRDKDRSHVVGFTDLIARLFLSSSTLLSAPRSVALSGLNSFSVLRKEIASNAMGLSGEQSRLVRGLALELEAD